MKKWLVLGITAVAAAMTVVLFALPISAKTYGDLTYEIVNGEVKITGCDTSAGGALIIPAEIEGYPVTMIGYSVFKNCSSLKSIEIPDSVTSIDSEAISGCTGLTSIVIGDGLTSIGLYVFSGCPNLISIRVSGNNQAYKSIDGNLYTKDGRSLIQYAVGKSDRSFEIPNGVTTIDSFAFSDCTSLIDVKIPDSVTTIGYYAFLRCSGLTSVEIGEGVLLIRGGAFEDCTNLTSVVIPESATAIELDAFRDCSSLEEIFFLFPYTAICESATIISSTATIYGYENSTAQVYAEEYNRSFVSLGSYHTCVFDQKDLGDQYQDAVATCTSPAEYFYSCICGKKGTATFAGGRALGHRYSTRYDDTCDVCGYPRNADRDEDALKKPHTGNNSVYLMINTGAGACLVGALLAVFVAVTKKKK